MNNKANDPFFNEYMSPVIEKLKSIELSSTFSDCTRYLVSHVQSMPAWQIAIPVIACIAAGGSIDDGAILASAWTSLNLASEILDNVEDKELTGDQFLTSPEVASNIATGLIFTSFQILTSIQDATKANQITRILSNCGLDAAYGQHRDLIQEQLAVELVLNTYWENIILKAGSVFRAATQGGAAVAGANETISEALGDYGTALGVILQLFDDCRDAFSNSEEAINWEISLPLLLYLMTVSEENIIFPKINSRAEWSDLLQKTGVIHAIAELLLQWKSRALESLSSLPPSREKLILERIPSLILKRIPSLANEVVDEYNNRSEFT
ncbi:MAG: hypothetical protein C3F13_16475 [Anaerolineales bacterium]|nr:MAG: hypothetical protein C3F13_16475 [Anaerolineales bacterium]